MTLLVKIGTGPLTSVLTLKRKKPVVGEKFLVRERERGSKWISVRCTDIKEIGQGAMYMVERF